MSQSPRTSQRTLYLRTDDAGLCVHTNRAIAEIAGAGLPLNVSVMAPGPALMDVVKRLSGRRNVCIGLHVCLNCEWQSSRFGPVSDPATVPELLRSDGTLFAEPHELQARSVPTELMMREPRAQLARLRSVGLQVGYIDTHMGVGWVNGLGDQLELLAKEQGLIYVDRLRCERFDESVYGTAFDAPPSDAASDGPPLLWVKHPRVAAPEAPDLRVEFNPRENVTADRDAEYRALIDPALPDRLRLAGLTLRRFDDAR
jgi:chitin disaccharide deacetylase